MLLSHCCALQGGGRASIPYTCGDNGNLLSDGARSYTYDHANRLTQVVSGTLTTQYGYNGDGARVSKAVDSATTQYLVGPER